MARTQLTRRSLIARGFVAGGAIGLVGARPLEAAGAVPRGAVFHMALPSVAEGHPALHTAGGWLTGAAVRAPARFDLLGIEWASPEQVELEVRVSLGRRGGWSRWTPAHVNHGHRPDGTETSILRTDPIWTGGSDLLQLRASRPLHGAVIHFVNSTGTTTPAGRARAILRDLAGAASLGRLVTPRLAAGPGQPPVIARKAWAGGAVRPRRRPAYGQVAVAFVHHTETANDYRPHQSAAMVRAVAHYHRDVERWNDIGYNFLVDKYGQVFEGRAGGIDEAVEGAQAGGFNASSTGVGCLGSFVSHPESARGINALAHLLAWKLALHGVPAIGATAVKVSASGAAYSRFPANAQVFLKHISGHRDADSTDCPGGGLYRQLPHLRSSVRRLAGRISNLSMSGPPGPVTYPAPATVAGSLSLYEGPPIAGASVELQVREPPGSQTVVATAVTGSDGSWSASLDLARSAPVRALFRGGPPYSAVVSQTIAIEVAPMITLAAPAGPASGSSFTITGTVSPPKPIVRLVVLHQAADGSFQQVAQPTVAAANGSFARTLILPGPGRYRITAESAADSVNARGMSAPLDLAVG
ncbi:MAG: hypothetical protein NVSMB25_21250 [Thermoleophilaceae bacterium]